MAEETIEQMDRLLGGTGAVSDMEIDQYRKSLMGGGGAVSDMEMQGMAPPMRPEGMGAVSQADIEMITSAQQGLMEMDPDGTKDIVDGLEVTKNKVMAGGNLTEVESTGIMAILQKLGGALGGMMGGSGDRMTYMVDGNPVEMTESERMSAINAGMLVQDVESGIRGMEPMTGSSTMTPDELMMESSGSTMTDAERAIRGNAEFNRRVQEEQERMFRMNNPDAMSSVRPRLRQQEGFLVTPEEGGIPAVPMPNVMPDLSPEEMEQMRIMREIRERQSLERDPSGMTQLLGG
jgi:hypothetical protein|tara:strand:- start:49 stop:921 length:873 start_codon:yes stop_codon:yes gene_type:complete